MIVSLQDPVITLTISGDLKMSINSKYKIFSLANYLSVLAIEMASQIINRSSGFIIWLNSSIQTYPLNNDRINDPIKRITEVYIVIIDKPEVSFEYLSDTTKNSNPAA